MTLAQQYNRDQLDRWNGADGELWVREQERLDRMLAPFLAPLLKFAAPRHESTVIDVGCGCGATTVELARAVGPFGRVIGVDISEPMIGRAVERLRGFENASFLLGDAAELPLDGIGADLVFSRFGVMFFGDPAAAFANLRTALAAGGRARFLCWRPLPENDWMQVPVDAAYKHVAPVPDPAPEEPGAFSFADPARVTRILTGAGLTSVTLTPLNLPLDLAAGGGLHAAVLHAADSGPTRRALANQPDDVRARVFDSIRAALTPYASGDSVRMSAAAWLVAADRG